MIGEWWSWRERKKHLEVLLFLLFFFFLVPLSWAGFRREVAGITRYLATVLARWSVMAKADFSHFGFLVLDTVTDFEV